MGIKRKAYAKINLSLDVKGKLANGYHEVCMVMQTVDIYDELSFDIIKNVSGDDRIQLTCTITGKGRAVITDDVKDNLIYKAAALLLPRIPEDEGVSIELIKNIPMAAGMAGGSTDAAAVLRGMNQLFELGLTDEELCELGVTIGADVPYCIMGGTMLAEGIGEKLTKLPSAEGLNLVIAKPAEGVSTAYVYKTLDGIDYPPHPDVNGMMKAIGERYNAFFDNNEDAKIAYYLGNILEYVTVPVCPKVQQIKAFLIQNGAMGAIMSGSGPSVFGIFRTREDARKAAAVLKEMDDSPAVDVFVTRTI